MANGVGSEKAGRTISAVDVSALVQIPEDDLFIRKAYWQILNRECDPGSFVNCLELLRRHTPRRVLLENLVQSDEAHRRGVPFEGLPAPATPRPERRSRLAHVRRLAFKAYDFSRRAWNAPFNSLDQKLTLILRELASRIDELRDKSDKSLWTLSEKLDAYGVASNTGREHVAALADSSARMEERIAALEQHLTASVSSLSTKVSLLVAGQENFVAAYRRPPILLGGNNIFITELDGFIIGQPGEEWRMAAFHALRGVMEPGLVRRLQRLLKPGMTFVDVGANIGVMTLHAAICVAPNGKVHSFEPAPRTFQILKDNVQVNGLLESGLIELHCAAVSDAVAQAELSVYPADSGHNTLFGSAGDSRIAVDTVTLDSVLEGRQVDVVKIDAEGAEPSIVRGMRNTLRANPHLVVLLEFAPTHLRRAGIEPISFLQELQSSGFTIHVVDDATGHLSEPDLLQLTTAFSVNLELTRPQ